MPLNNSLPPNLAGATTKLPAPAGSHKSAGAGEIGGGVVRGEPGVSCSVAGSLAGSGRGDAAAGTGSAGGSPGDDGAARRGPTPYPGTRSGVEDRAAHLRQVRKALVFLEEAQNALYSAAGQMCSVEGFAPEWSKLCKMGDGAKELWYRIEEKRGGRVDR